MFGQERRRNLRNTETALDMVHIIICILIVILAVISFLNPEGNMLLFPVIFLLAAALNFVNGFYQVKYSDRDKKKKLSGLVLGAFGLLLFLLAVVSAVSIWWG